MAPEVLALPGTTEKREGGGGLGEEPGAAGSSPRNPLLNVNQPTNSVDEPEKWDGWGFEYKSPTTLFGLPLLHISFKYRPNRMPVPAKGIISVGQFGAGIINFSQFGLGVISVSQFTIAGFAVAQFALAGSGIAQFGLYLHEGYGQCIRNLLSLF